MKHRLRGISSMATRRLLESLVGMWHQRGGTTTEIRSIGGVDAFRMVSDGAEPLDLVFLASGSIDKLMVSRRILRETKVDVAISRVAIAVRKGAPKPDVSNGLCVRESILAAKSIGYSTGPSGAALLRLLERWNIKEQLYGRLVQASPGVPVGALVADGKAELGFQQLSELIHVGGIDVVGTLPPDIQITTVFSGAVVSGSDSPADAREFLAFTRTEDAVAAKRAEGLEPVPT